MMAMACNPESAAPNTMLFFFQAEDGIRDHCVTGVQTCALPICRLEVRWERSPAPVAIGAVAVALLLLVPAAAVAATPAQRAKSYLANAQNDDGGFGPTQGAGSSPLYTGWAGLGLGSAGRNPLDVRRPGGRSRSEE